jgi:hypothetical protein
VRVAGRRLACSANLLGERHGTPRQKSGTTEEGTWFSISILAGSEVVAYSPKPAPRAYGNQAPAEHQSACAPSSVRPYPGGRSKGGLLVHLLQLRRASLPPIR